MSISRNKLSFLFTICVILTVTLNCTQEVSTLNGIDLILTDSFWIIIDNLASISNYLLFVIFGYLLGDNNYTLKELAIGVFNKLLVPYLIWQFIMAIAKVVVLGQDLASIQFIKTVFLFGAWPPNGPMYLMYPMVIFGLLSPLFIKLFKSQNKYLSNITLILVSCFLLHLHLQSAFPKDLTINISLFYLSGTVLGMYIAINITKENFARCLLIYILFMGVFTIIYKINLRLMITVVMSTVLLLCPFANTAHVDSKNWFIVYAIHPVLIVMILPAIQSLFAYGILKNVCGSIVVVTTSYLVAIIANYFIKLINKLINKESSIFNLITIDFHK